MPTRKRIQPGRQFAVGVCVNIRKMGKASGEFLRLNNEFSGTAMGQRLLPAASKFEGSLNDRPIKWQPVSHERYKRNYLGAVMDYYNRLLFYAKEKGASGAVISYLGLHVRGLEKEYEKFSKPE